MNTMMSIFFVLLSVTLLSSIGLAKYAFISIAAVLIFLCKYFQNSKKSRLRVLILFGVALATIAAFYRKLVNGIKIILNAIFEISASNQSYEYDLFKVTNDAKAISIFLSIFVLTLLISCILLLINKKYYLICATALFTLTLVFFIYFGIMPNSLAFVAFSIFFGLLLCNRQNLSKYIRTFVFAILIFATCALFVNESSTISTADDFMRDKLAFNTVYYENTSADSSASDETEEKPETEEKSKMFDFAFDIQFTGTTHILTIAGIIILLMFIASFIADKYKKKVEKIRGPIASKNNAIAVNAQFLYAAKWLIACGLEIESPSYTFRSSSEDLPVFLTSEYLSKLEKMEDLFKEASFSTHNVPKKNRNEMYEFLKETENIVWKKSNLKAKIRIKLKCKLRQEDKYE